jgi:hypothetical protein
MKIVDTNICVILKYSLKNYLIIYPNYKCIFGIFANLQFWYLGWENHLRKLIIIEFVRIFDFENQLFFFENNPDTWVGSPRHLVVKWY